MKGTSLSFRSFDLNWPSMLSLAKETTTTQPAFDFFYQNEDVNLCHHCCHCSVCLLWCRLGQRQWIMCVAHLASVAHMMHAAIVTWLLFFIVLHEFFILCFVVVLNVLITGDLRHEYAQSACLEDLLIVVCVRPASVAAIDAPLKMIVVAGWVLLWYSQCPHDSFVAFIGKTALWLRGSLPRLSLLG